MAPWSAIWEHNRFTDARPALEALVQSPYARGGVTGVGVLTALAGLVELGSIFVARARRSEGGSPDQPAS